MAKVEMDLAELKQLEKKIEDLEKDKQTLIDNQHQVIIYHKHFDGKIKLADKKYINGVRVDIMGCRFVPNDDRYPYTTFYSQMYNDNITFEQLLESGLININLTENSSKTTKDYKNMSEVIEEIRSEEKVKVKNELEEALQRATRAEYNNNIIKDEYEKLLLDKERIYINNIEKLQGDHLKKVESLKESHNLLINKLNEKYDILLKEFYDYKANKKRISLEEQIEALTSELNSLRSKNLWQRLLNK